MSHPVPPPANTPPGEMQPLRFPAAPPPPVLGETGQPVGPPYPPAYAPGPQPGPPYRPGPPHPAGMQPGPPFPGPPRPPAKKSRAGLIVLILAGVLVLCLGGGIGGWYAFLGGDEVVDEWNEEAPPYPQEYTYAVPPAAGGHTYDDPELGLDEAVGLCASFDQARLGALLAVQSAVKGRNDLGHSILHECDLEVSNLDAYPTGGAYGFFEISVQRFPTPEEAERDFDKAGELDATQEMLPVDGFDVEASSYQAVMDPEKDSTTRIAVFAVDGNVLVTGRFEVIGTEGKPSGMPVHVMRGVTADVMNEVMASIAP